MLNREDLLELTRRMTPKRNCFTRIAGGYMTDDGYMESDFNVHFQKLSPKETERMLSAVKAIPFSQTNKELKEHRFPGNGPDSARMRQLLTALIQCELKNGALLQTLYELIAEKYQTDSDYAILVCQGNYDIPIKGSDKEFQGESEEVYSFLICAICPQEDYEITGETLSGFLYPSFSDRSADPDHIAVFHKSAAYQDNVLLKVLGTE